MSHQHGETIRWWSFWIYRVFLWMTWYFFCMSWSSHGFVKAMANKSVISQNTWWFNTLMTFWVSSWSKWVSLQIFWIHHEDSHKSPICAEITWNQPCCNRSISQKLSFIANLARQSMTCKCRWHSILVNCRKCSALTLTTSWFVTMTLISSLSECHRDRKEDDGWMASSEVRVTSCVRRELHRDSVERHWARLESHHVCLECHPATGVEPTTSRLQVESGTIVSCAQSHSIWRRTS